MTFETPQEVIIDVKPDGSVSIEAVGFEGSACEKATQAIRDALGTTTVITKKPEYHRPARTVETTKQKARY